MSQDNALKFLLNDDQIQMRNLLAEICPIEDTVKRDPEAGGHGKKSCSKNNKPIFPLAEDHWINQPYDKEQGYKSLLQLAIEQGKEDFVKAMLSAGARADLYNENLGQAPIHVAAEADNLGMLKILLDFMDKKPTLNKANIGAFNKTGQTVLHIAAAKNSLAILRYLLGHPDLKDVDPKDLNGSRTPLYMAAKNSHAESVELLVAHGGNLGHRCFGKTAQDLINENMPYFDTSKVKIQQRPAQKWNLCEHLNTLLDKAQRNMLKHTSNAQNHLEFVIYLQQVSCQDFNNHDAQGMGLFQKAASYGLHEHVLTMLENKMDPNVTVDECSSKPALLAAYGGFYKVLQILKDHKTNRKVECDDGQAVTFSTLEFGTKESILHWVLKKTLEIDHEDCDYDKCFQVLMSPGNVQFDHEINRIINHKDSEHNTPLHYATQLWNQDVVRQLLERGGNIGMRNHWEETPITLIMPETMEAFLDEYCLQSSKEVTHADFELEYNYSFLAPPVDDPNYDENDPEGQKIIENAALPETESLWYMSQSKHHRHLLQHPVIMSFLWLKWQRIRGYFNRNVRFYLMFVVCLSWYIFERFGGISSRMTRNDDNDKKNSTCLLYTSPSPRDRQKSRMPSSA